MQGTDREAGDQAGPEDLAREAPGSGYAGGYSRSWSDEEKACIVQESFERGATVSEVAQRHGVPIRRLSKWRKQVRKGVLSVSQVAEVEDPFATIALESSSIPVHVGSVSIECRGVTVRLDGDVSTVRITSIASALRRIR